ncbi:MAG: preprotein translocase subunit YajC [bacterium]|nr:preprotein translocase subunit YajC [bacterium]
MNLDLFSTAAWAQEAANRGAAAAPGAPPTAAPFSPLLLMFGALAVLFYFMILRPQKRDQAKRQAMLNTIAKGDDVVTSGGIHGSVESVNQNEGVVTVNVAPKVNIRFSKAAIVAIVKKKDKGGQAEG